MKKLVNIEAKSPVRTITPPLMGKHYRVELSYGEILKCICARAIVDEILPNGKLLRLDLANYNKVNYVEEVKTLEPTPAVEEDEEDVSESISEENSESVETSTEETNESENTETEESEESVTEENEESEEAEDETEEKLTLAQQQRTRSTSTRNRKRK